MIGFNRRFAPVYRKAKEIYKDQAPDVIVAQKNRPASEYRATLENAIHMVDLMRYLSGECVSVEAHSIFTDPCYETLCTAQLQFENGTVIRPAVFSDGPVPDDPYRFYIEWGYQYTNGVIDGQVDTNKTFMVDPTRIKSFRLNGVEIPFRYDPA